MNKLLLWIVTLFLLSIGSAFADCGGSCQTNFCGGSSSSVGSNCQCTDPSCGNNSCLSAEACCRAFGNIGAASYGSPSDDDSDAFYQDYSYNSFSQPSAYKGSSY